MEESKRKILTEDDIAEVISKMIEGITLKQACEKSGVSYCNINKRINESENLTKLHARARDEFAHVCVQKMFDIVDLEEDVQRARLKCDNIKWYAARVLPKVYGDKMHNEVSGPDGQPLTAVITRYKEVN